MIETYCKESGADSGMIVDSVYRPRDIYKEAVDNPDAQLSVRSEC